MDCAISATVFGMEEGGPEPATGAGIERLEGKGERVKRRVKGSQSKKGRESE